MWQDYAIMVVQVVFALALIPTLLDKNQKPAPWTSIFNTLSMAVLIAAYYSLKLWWSAGIATLVALEWSALGYQRCRLDAQSNGANIPLRKLWDILLMR